MKWRMCEISNAIKNKSFKQKNMLACHAQPTKKRKSCIVSINRIKNITH